MAQRWRGGMNVPWHVGRLTATWPLGELLLDDGEVTIQNLWARPSVTLPLDGATTVSMTYRVPLLYGVLLRRDDQYYMFGLLSGNAALHAALVAAGARPVPRPSQVALAGGRRRLAGAVLYLTAFMALAVLWIRWTSP